MSVLYFDLKKEHIDIVRHLNWGLNGYFITTQKTSEHTSSFDTTSNYEGFDLILNGKKTIDDECFGDECFSEEEKNKMDQLFSELPIAIEIIMFTGKFEVGRYRTKYNNKNWVKVQ